MTISFISKNEKKRFKSSVTQLKNKVYLYHWVGACFRFKASPMLEVRLVDQEDPLIFFEYSPNKQNNLSFNKDNSITGSSP